jgi:16S rRNA processing protein RimM
MAFEWDEMAVVGRIARPHGLAGTVIVDPETDFPQSRFAVGRTVYVREAARVVPLRIGGVRAHQGRLLVTFDDVGSLARASSLAGRELRVPVADLTPLPPGVYYRHDLVGCDVRTGEGELVGRVAAVEGPLEASRLVVRGPRGEVLVPLAASICVAFDLARRLIVIDAPEGLLELNAPGWRRNP